jgi:UDP-N-acetylglucosamine 4,6-dehydratase
MFENQRVLVTGGTGSFGHHIVRRLLQEDLAEIRILSRDEDKQYRMGRTLDMLAHFPRHNGVHFVLGDVRDPHAVDVAMRDVDIVFHAAALKQVPFCEYNVLEAVKTNILGAQNVIDAALAHDVKAVVAVSTDKAVKPVNTMGMTKAIQEKLFTDAASNSSSTRFSCVRYGNVIGSRGSVIPLFKELILGGKPVTITDPNMTRFVITLEEAIDLVLYAAQYAVGGEVFVRGAPAVRIPELAEAMIKALAPGQDIPIEVVGVRPGEKIHEILVSEAEARRTYHGHDEDIFVILPQIRIEQTLAAYTDARPVSFVEYSSNEVTRLDVAQMIEVLRKTGWVD